MKTLVAILALLVCTTVGVNAQTKTAVKISDLPKAISENLSTQHKDWTPSEAFKLDTKGVISYEVLAKKENSGVNLFYDKDGKFTKSEPVTIKKEPKKETTPVKTDAKKPTEMKSSSSKPASNTTTQKTSGTKKTEKQ
jgi:hypothetical protein